MKLRALFAGIAMTLAGNACAQSQITSEAGVPLLKLSNGVEIANADFSKEFKGIKNTLNTC